VKAVAGLELFSITLPAVGDMPCIYVDREAAERLKTLKAGLERAAGRRVTRTELLIHLAEVYECGSFCV
jgi:hypothetical protein